MSGKTIWCFGDSNTYGYDPQGLFGGKYAKSWPELLAEKRDWRVINDGQNGRSIPAGKYELSEFRRKAGLYSADLVVVMLGTNDLLNGASAEETSARLNTFLNECGAPRVMLIAPPKMKRGAWVADDGLVHRSKELSRLYRQLADQRGVPFADAGEWGIELTFDGVHFTEDGHLSFAGELFKVLDEIV